MKYTGEGVPFSFFCALIREISQVQPTALNTKKQRARQPSTSLDYPALGIFKAWVEELTSKFSPLPPNTTAICFRLLFPEEDVRRKYDIQETRMTGLLLDSYGLDKSSFELSESEEASGCLGHELKMILERSCPYEDGYISPLSIAEVDELLVELASKSGYSHRSVRSKYLKSNRRGRSEIMRSLFRRLAPLDASVLTQIILKDLRPLLYPLSEWHYSTALTKLNSASVKMLTKEHAMNAWDSSKAMLRFYRVRCDIDQAAAFVDQPEHSRPRIVPTLGSMIAVPKSEKGLSCEHALTFFDSGIVWAENKYDGERAQIHVALEEDGSSHITIFSKSKRDSTLDRHALHDIIRQALGLDSKRTAGPHNKRRIRENIVIDAEMVAFRGDKIEEFWHIRRLIENTAEGIRYGGGNKKSEPKALGKRKAMDSEVDEDGLHLGLVFFDILYLDSSSLLYQPYKSRREILESVTYPEPGKAILAKRFPIDMSQDPERELRHIFSYSISDYQEGLVLKGENSFYNDFCSPWVKLKKDYIPNCGDTVELLILGASWEKVRGRTLRVPPTTFTTFNIGALDTENEEKQGLPHFHAYFTVSYGLNRKELEQLNFLIKNSDTVPYTSLDKSDLPHRVSFLKGSQPPTVVLKTPLVASLMGAGYTKARDSEHYELRFPRLLRVYRTGERDWRHVINLQSLDEIAHISVGKDRPGKDDRDWASTIFGIQASPGIKSTWQRKKRANFWNEKLKRLGTMPSTEVDSSPPDWTKYEEEAIPRPLFVKTNTLNSVTIPPEVITKVPIRPSKRTAGKSSPKPKKSKPSKGIEEGYYIYFQRPEKGVIPTCKWYAAFKRRCVDSGRQVQSVETLLSCCGWTGERAAEIKQGMIVVHECADGAATRKTVEVVERNGRSTEGRAKIVVYTCQKNKIVLS